MMGSSTHLAIEVVARMEFRGVADVLTSGDRAETNGDVELFDVDDVDLSSSTSTTTTLGLN